MNLFLFDFPLASEINKHYQTRQIQLALFLPVLGKDGSTSTSAKKKPDGARWVGIFLDFVSLYKHVRYSKVAGRMERYLS